MKRREFITLLGGAAAWPLTAHAQQAKMPVIGWISSRAASESDYLVAAFRQGLKETGYMESQNVALDFRWGEGRYDRLPAHAAELVGRPATVIVATGGDPAAQAAKAATATIPIIFVSGSDPVKVGLVASLNRPGGNITGVHLLLLGMGAKRLGMLHELVPAANPIGVLTNPNFADGRTQLRDVEDAAKSLGLDQSRVVAHGPRAAQRPRKAAMTGRPNPVRLAAEYAGVIVTHTPRLFRGRSENR